MSFALKLFGKLVGIHSLHHRDPKLDELIRARDERRLSASQAQAPKEIRPTEPPIISVADKDCREPEADEPVDFIDDGILITMAKNGVATKRYGTAYLFDNIWSQLFVLDMPDFDERIFDRVGKFDCVDFIALIHDNYTEKVLSGGPQGLTNVLTSACTEVEKVIAVQINNTIWHAKSAINDFKSRQLSRTKREPFTLAAIGLGVGALVAGGGFLAGWLTNRNSQIDDLYKKFDDLAQVSDLHSHAIQVHQEKLIGLAQSLADSNRYFEDKINLLQTTVQIQLNSLAYVLGKQIDKLHKNQYTLSILTFHTLFKMLKVNSAQQTAAIILDFLGVWDIIFTDLRRNVMSHSLISWKTLKPLLEDIQCRLKDSYRLGIPISRYELYYRMELVNYRLIPETNKLLIYFQIPLARKHRPMTFQLISLHSMGFPCKGTLCSLVPAKNDSIQLLAAQPTNKVWVVHQNQIYREGSSSDFACLLTGAGRSCFSFSPEMLSIPSDCSQSILHWNDSMAAKSCNFVQKSKREYRPIPVSQFSYIIHPDIITQYTTICKDSGNEIHRPEGFASLIEIQPRCQVYMPDIQHTLIGPFDGMLNNSMNLTTKTYHSTFLEVIKASMNDTQRMIGIDRIKAISSANFIREFKPDEYSLNFTFDNERLTQITTYLYQTQNDLAQVVTGVNYRLDHSRIRFTIWSYISVLGDFIKVLTTLVIIFGLITYTGFFGMFMSHVVIMDRIAVEAAPINPSFTPGVITPGFLENTESSIASIFLVLACLVLFALYITVAYFRTTYISNHCGTAVVRNVNSDFAFVLNFKHQLHKLIKIQIEDIYIRFPLKDLPNGVEDIRVITPKHMWTLQNKCFHITPTVEINGLNKGLRPVYEKGCNIDLPLRNIRWDSSEPTLLSLDQMCGDAYISVMRKRELSPSVQEHSF